MTWLLIGLAVIVVIGVSVGAWMGAFLSIEITEVERGPYTFVYREMGGTNMSEVRKITTELAVLLSEKGIERRLPFDVHFPDGRSEIGFPVEDVSVGQLAGISDSLQVREISTRRCMITHFPYRNVMSFVIGYFKIDGALKIHREAHGYAKVEAFAVNLGNTILYGQPIVAQ